MKIGEREYELPFAVLEDLNDTWYVYRITDATGKLVLNVGGVRHYSEKENAKYKAFAEYVAEALNNSARIKELEKDNARLREALEVYADEKNWCGAFVGSDSTFEQIEMCHLMPNEHGYDLAKTALENSEAAKGEG